MSRLLSQRIFRSGSSRERSYPRVVKRRSHNFYRVKKPADHGTRYYAPPTIRLTNPANLQLAA